jgi:predicted TIM-barrel enzyme
MDIDKFFPKKHNVLAVIHCEDLEQVLRNSAIAAMNGVDGVFLINHKVSVRDLIGMYYEVKKTRTNLWVGVNLLGINDVKEAIELAGRHKFQGLWVDDAGYRELNSTPTLFVRKIPEWKEMYGAQETIIFGGVAFKYQSPPVLDVATAASSCAPFVDVVTTSGDRTGVPPTVEKIAKMKEAMGDYPLANASGLDTSNVANYRDMLKFSLVGTSLVYPGTENFEPLKVRQFMYATRH